MPGPLQLQFIASGSRHDQLPDHGPEVAVVGRSNVGKSSLINALGNRKNLAHVSKSPGRTRLLNQFTVDGVGAFVDCPGYGYASAPGQMRADWKKMIEGYLVNREALQMVMVLVDGEVGPTKLDVQMLEWLRSERIPHTVIATKHDKVKSGLRSKRKTAVAKGCELEEGDVVWVSAAKGVGLDRLRALIRMWVTAPQ